MEKYQKYILLIILAFLVFFLRLYWIDLTIMEGDMFRDFEIAESILQGNVRYVGVASIEQTYNQQGFGPVMYYLLALIIYIFKNPLYVAVFVAVLNAIAVLITFKFCREYFNEKVAFIASFLYAVNPWSVYLSHTHWNPNYLPFFSVLFFYFLFGFVVKAKDNFLIYTSFIVAVMLHFHLTPLFFIPLIILSILLFRRDIKFSKLAYSLGAFIVPFVPYIYFNLKNNISLFGPIFYGAARESSGFLTSFIEAFGIPVMLATNYLGRYVYGASNIFGYKSVEYLLLFVTIILIVLFFLSFVYLLLRIRFYWPNKKENTQIKLYFLLIISLAIVPILHFFRFSNLSPHYFFLMYPLQFVCIALFLVFLFKKYKVAKTFFVVAFVILLCLQVFNVYLLFNYVNRNGATNGGEFSIPYKDKVKIINYLKEDIVGKPIKVVFFRQGKSFRYLFDRYLNEPKYYYLNSTSQFDNVADAYLILDRVSYHGVQLTNEEVHYFSKLGNRTVIGQVEIYKI